jgi:hypothetical protein
VLTFGTGTNVLNVDTFNIGLSKLGGNAQFASQAASSPGTLVITNKAGNGGANLTIGSHNGTATGAVIAGLLDLRGHAATITAATVGLGLSNNTSNGSATGTINFDGGTFTASALNPTNLFLNLCSDEAAPFQSQRPLTLTFVHVPPPSALR